MPGPGRRAMFLTEEEKQNSPKVTKELLLRVFSYLKPYRKQLALVFICIIAASVCSLFPSILTGNIVDVLTGKNAGMLTVGCSWGYRDRDVLVESQADFVLDDPTQLVEIFA